MEYAMYPPHKKLREYVRFFWTARVDIGAQQTFETKIDSFADRFPQLIFQDLDMSDPIKTRSGTPLSDLYLRGIVTTHPSFSVQNSFSHVGVSFYPHAPKRFFHLDADALTNALPDIRLFASAHRLLDQLRMASTDIAKIDLLTKFLIERLNEFSREDATIRELMHSADFSMNWTVQDLQKYFRVTERQLERKFKSEVGVTPWRYLQLVRFEKALGLLNKRTFKNFYEVAYHLDFSDQSHFSRDFKKFSGFTPNDYLTLPVLGDETSAFVVQKSSSEY
jgi:AraC-like DNA-binding protein